GAVRTTLRPPCRSRPSRGFLPRRKRVPSSPTTTRATRRMETTKRRVPLTSATLSDQSEKLVAIDDEAELTVEELGRPPAHRHTVQEDLEVLHDLRDRRVDLELEGQRPVSGVHGKYGGLGCEVHPVMDVEGLEVLVADPRTVDV